MLILPITGGANAGLLVKEVSARLLCCEVIFACGVILRDC